MIPGEILPADGDIELNAGLAAHHADRRQHRRPADPGRQPLPFRGDQPGAVVRPRQPRAASVSTSPPAPRCVSNRARRAKSPWCRIAAAASCRASAPPSWERSTDGPHASRRLCRHVRPDHRRSRPARRHRPDRRGGTRPHHLRRGGEVRRRQGDPRRHGPVAGVAGGRRGRYGDHQRADHRSLGHREGRCRDHQRPHREDRQGRQSRHPAGCRHHHRPGHRDHRRRGQDPHRRRHRCAYPLHLPAAGGGCDRVRHHHADRRRHRPGDRHRGHHLHAGPVASRAHAAGGRGTAGQSRLRRQGQRVASGRAGGNDPRRRGVPEAARGLGHHARRDRLRAVGGRPVRRAGDDPHRHAERIRASSRTPSPRSRAAPSTPSTPRAPAAGTRPTSSRSRRSPTCCRVRPTRRGPTRRTRWTNISTC